MDGRADEVTGHYQDPNGRCVRVYVDSNKKHYKNCFYKGNWHKWVYDPG